MNIRAALLIISLSAFLALSGCSKAPETRSAADVPTAKKAVPTQTEVGDYTILHTAITTDQLPAEVASQYKVPRSKSRVLLNVVLKKRTADGKGVATSGKVSAKANNLTGQLKNITMKRITEGDAIYFIGQTSIADGEHLTFNIEALPDGETKPLNVTFQQQFYTK